VRLGDMFPEVVLGFSVSAFESSLLEALGPGVAWSETIAPR
jgi:hypothetical protein